MIDSGEIKDPDIGGGKLGLMCFSQEKVIWSAVSARCLGKCKTAFSLPVLLSLPSLPLLCTTDDKHVIGLIHAKQFVFCIKLALGYNSYVTILV